MKYPKEAKSIEEMYELHLKQEPSKKWIFYDKEVDRGITTSEWFSWDFYKKKLKALVDLGKEKREEILKVIKSGKKLGEVSDIFNLDEEIISDVLYCNIKQNTHYSINEESI